MNTKVLLCGINKTKSKKGISKWTMNSPTTTIGIYPWSDGNISFLFIRPGAGFKLAWFERKILGNILLGNYDEVERLLLIPEDEKMEEIADEIA